MKLIQFRIRNFRSILDSGFVNITKLTSLIGKNDSGKSNVLIALSKNIPPDRDEVIESNENLPLGISKNEKILSIPFLTTIWDLKEYEKDILLTSPLLKNVTSIMVKTFYDNPNPEFIYIQHKKFTKNRVYDLFDKIEKKIHLFTKHFNESGITETKNSLAEIEAKINKFENTIVWSLDLIERVTDLYHYLIPERFKENNSLYPHITELIDYIEVCKPCIVDDMQETFIQEGLYSKMLYFDKFELIDGTQNLNELIKKKKMTTISEREGLFLKMFDMVGIDPLEINQNSGGNRIEFQNKLLTDAGKRLTKIMQSFWKNQDLVVRFQLNGESIHTFISDSDQRDNYECGFDRRGLGFKWFFSFCVKFAENLNDAHKDDTILLLDEPGLHLHGKYQRDLVNHLIDDIDNQVIYSTHSPFMVPTQQLESVKTVLYEPKIGTTVSNRIEGDSFTLYPLHVALGCDLSQDLLISANQLIVEGYTDYLLLRSISKYLNRKFDTGLNDAISIVHANSVTKIINYVKLLLTGNINVAILIDDEKAARKVENQLTKDFHLSQEKIIYVSEILDKNKKSDTDIEDLLDPLIYKNLVLECFSEEIGAKKLKFNSKEPRIAKRFERAFNEINQKFEKLKLINFIIEEIKKEPESVITEEVKRQFEKLFGLINKKFTI